MRLPPFALAALAVLVPLGILMSVVSLPAETPPPETFVFRDDSIVVELPRTWHVDGESGEYTLESDEEDVGSLLLMPFDEEITFEERLAEIEEQFLATGPIELEKAESRVIEGADVSYRRYRLMMAGSEEGSDRETVHLHQYTFWRSDLNVLLQVESAPESTAPEELFRAVFGTLEVLAPPSPAGFDEPLSPYDPPAAEPDSSGGHFDPDGS